MVPFLITAIVMGLSQSMRHTIEFSERIALHLEDLSRAGRGGPSAAAAQHREARAPAAEMAAAALVPPAASPDAGAPAPEANAADDLALLAPGPAMQGVEPAEPTFPLPREETGRERGPGVCVAEGRPAAAREGGPATEFGRRLASAAREQLADFVVYNDKYQTIAYPMGDVPAFFGVCTDVVVRAYRALGIDLQAAVHEARAGSGDANIDHRRTEVLRRYFAAHGEELPVSGFAEDYLPGDIVTYYRPQNTASRSHIAVVSDVIGASGRPMIIHNRGWGPQMEDALFVDQITGHFRYSGPTDAAGPATQVAQRGRPRVAPARKASRIPVVRASYVPARAADRTPVTRPRAD
jgi:hypothetical protein